MSKHFTVLPALRCLSPETLEKIKQFAGDDDTWLRGGGEPWQVRAVRVARHEVSDKEAYRGTRWIHGRRAVNVLMLQHDQQLHS